MLCGTDPEELAKHLPKKYLPHEYGGENGSLDQISAEFNKVWDTHSELFKQNSLYGTDENLRLGEPVYFEGDLGVGGSFRKLDVD